MARGLGLSCHQLGSFWIPSRSFCGECPIDGRSSCVPPPPIVAVESVLAVGSRRQQLVDRELAPVPLFLRTLQSEAVACRNAGDIMDGWMDLLASIITTCVC
jgi:hypothetical protein